MASGFKQDMPPPGGYDPIQIARRLPKKLSGYTVFGLYLGVTVLGLLQFGWQKKKEMLRLLENNESRIALEPFINAERDRSNLIYLRKIREEEAEVMKDVVGWEVGKWKGQPVYYNLADRFPIIHAEHYYLHAKEKDMERRLMEKNYH